MRIPTSHADLVNRPIHAVFTTIMPNGQPQSSLVWCDYDGECVRVNTTRQRWKGRNLARDPRVSLLIVDPDDTVRYIGIRGKAEVLEQGALEHLDGLTKRFTKHPAYYGYIYPITQQSKETRIICRIHAEKITLDAIHKAPKARLTL